MSDSLEAPDIDPVLSSGALKINPKKLDKVPWDHTGEHPGSRIAWAVIKTLAELSKHISSGIKRKSIQSIAKEAESTLQCISTDSSIHYR